MSKRVFKTTGKKISGGNNIYRSWDKWKIEDVMIGEYIGTGPSDKYGKHTFQFKVEQTFFSDKKAGKELEGKVVTLNFTGGFAKSMKLAEEGKFYQLTYQGQNEIQKGEWKGEFAHAIDVEPCEEEGGEDSDGTGGESDEDYDEADDL